MAASIPEFTPFRAARIAGVGYLIIICAGLFAEMFVRSGLIVPGDPEATASAIRASEPLFRLGIASDLVMLASDVVVAVALFVVFERVSRGLALLAAFFRLAHSAIYGITLLNLFYVLLLLGGGEYLAVLGPARADALALMFLDAHGYGYVIGLVFFGFHCLVLGWLLFVSGYVPRVLGVLMVVAGAGYLVDGFANVLMVDYAAWETLLSLVVFVPAVIGELSLCLWLLVKGVRVAGDALSPQ